jgi:hypothetical protein
LAFDAHKNLAVSTVVTAPSPALSGTTLTVTAGHGSRFPAVPFNATVCPAGTLADPSNAEIVRVTARTTDTLTITRAQESTSARSIVTGDQIFVAVTVKTLTDIEAALIPPTFPARRVVRPTTTGYDVISGDPANAGTITGSYLTATLGAATARTAIQAAINECGTGSPPTPSGGTFVDRGAVALMPGRYVIDQMITVGYWCSAIFGTLPSAIDRALPSDELLSGAVLEWGGASGSVNYVLTATNKSLTSNVATITTSTAHQLAIGASVTIALSPGDATFDGTFTITAITSTTFSYAKTAANVASTATGGTVTGTGTTDVPYAMGMSCLLQIGTASSTGTRKQDNPHGFHLRDVSFAATSSFTNFTFVRWTDTNDVFIELCNFAGNYGSGSSCITIHSTMAPDDGSVLGHVRQCYARDIWHFITIPPESTGATDGAIYDCWTMAARSWAITCAKGGWLILGGHYTTNATTGGLGHIQFNGGGNPAIVSNVYFDTVKNDATSAHISTSNVGILVRDCQFKANGTSQVFIIDASGSTHNEHSFTGNQINPNGSTALVSFVNFNNNTNTNLITTSALANSGATTISVNALSAALAVGDIIRFGNGVHARLTATAAISATSITVAALRASIPSGTVGTVKPVQVANNTLQLGGGITAWKGFAVTTGGTVLDYLPYHAASNNRELS